MPRFIACRWGFHERTERRMGLGMNDDKQARFLELCERSNAIRNQMLQGMFSDKANLSDLEAQNRAVWAEAEALMKEFS